METTPPPRPARPIKREPRKQIPLNVLESLQARGFESLAAWGKANRKQAAVLAAKCGTKADRKRGGGYTELKASLDREYANLIKPYL